MSTEFTHRGQRVVEDEANARLEINGQPAQVETDPDSGQFVSPSAPYVTATNLDDLGRAVAAIVADEESKAA